VTTAKRARNALGLALGAAVVLGIAVAYPGMSLSAAEPPACWPADGSSAPVAESSDLARSSAKAAGAGRSVNVASIGGLLDALADDEVGEIVVADGTYRVRPAYERSPDSLWIGARFAGRSRPVTVRAQTTGGVVIDGGGATSYGGITFAEGAHDQTWDGFAFTNGEPTQTGVIVFGGYAGLAAPHDITVRHITMTDSLTSSTNGDHAVYVGEALGGVHDVLIEDLTVDGRPGRPDGLDSALHFFHGDSANPNAWNVTARRITVSGTDRAIVFWNPTLHDVLVDGLLVDRANVAIRYEAGAGITLECVRTTRSRQHAFYSMQDGGFGAVTFVDAELH
jgi:hypothetical protein